MSKVVQVSNVPDEVHHVLKSRAALAGQSLSDYLVKQLERIAKEELIILDENPAEITRQERDARLGKAVADRCDVQVF
ncbi:MAG: hypothetical protein ACFBZ9_13515 [Sphingomonadales bacterium]